MPPTTTLSRGDVVPREFVVAAITSNVDRRLFGDHRVDMWREAGLLFPSTVTAILRTVKQSLIRRRPGTLAPVDLAGFEGLLRRSLRL